MVERHEVVQSILDLYPSPSYLEIGVNQGGTFLKINARRKVAVDPHFLFDAQNSSDVLQTVEYFEITSDDYFARPASTFHKFEVIYIDGLHTFEQTLRDLLNSLMFLKPLGTIIIDDVIPSSYHASLPNLADVGPVRNFVAGDDQRLRDDGSWMGDVYKIPFFVESFLQQFSYATVSENHGQMVMWKQPRAAAATGIRGVEEVARLQFSDVVLRQSSFSLRPLTEICGLVKAAMLTA